MMRLFNKFVFTLLFALCSNAWSSFLFAQNENAKWYFGNYAGLDFMTSPPTIILNGNVPASTYYSTAISDVSGNLVIYTNGQTAWNASNAVIPNGTFLGNTSNFGHILITKQPGAASQFFLFNTTLGNTLIYSIFNMSLSAGQGSVTAKNIVVGPVDGTGKVTGTYHCNGTDKWIVHHSNNTSNAFKSFLLSSAGFNTVAVVSNVGSNMKSTGGQMKISPSGNKIAVADQGGFTPSWVEVSDFNNTNGIVSNPVLLMQLPAGPGSRSFHGVEFSPDGSKLYATERTVNNCLIHQWDLCAGSPTAIVASHYTISASATGTLGDMQLAKNGKIYFVTWGSTSLHVINAPDNGGSACNFVPNSQSIAPNTAWFLPKFITRHQNATGNFSHTPVPSSGCNAVSFTPAPNPSVSCAAANFSFTSLGWNFGDPLSGSNNTSSAINPVHLYSSAGSYTVMQILYYPCGSDTIRQVVNVSPPTVSVTTRPGCGGTTGAATVAATGGVGPYTYTWLPSQQTGNQISNLNSGTYTVVIFDQGLNCKSSTTLAILNYSALPVSVQPSSLITLCEGSSSLVTLQNYSGTYYWSPSAGLSSSGNGTLQVSSLTSQIYTITVNTSSCSGNTLLNVQVVSQPSVSISADKILACENSTVSLTGNGAVNYIWKFSENSFAYGPNAIAPVAAQSGNLATYTLTGTDANGCSNSAVKTVSVLPAPRGYLVLPKESLCAPGSTSFLFVATSPTSNVSLTLSGMGQNSTGIFNFPYPGVFTFTGTLTDKTNLCSTSIYSTITVYPKPEVDFTYSPLEIRAELDEVIFTSNGKSNGNKNEFNWFFAQGDKEYKSEGEQTRFVFEKDGIFPVAHVVKDENGCSDTITKIISVMPGAGIYIPNSFTPNGDGLNEVFIPIITGAKKYKLCIYDRWGANIFETEEIGKGWDGIYKGKLCKSDIYTWTLQSTSIFGTISKTGSVMLLR